MRKFISITYLICFISIINGQESKNLSLPLNEGIRIDSIKIFGNDITEEFVILRELTIEPGDTVNSEIIRFNKERIFSLGIFTRVELSVKELENHNNLVVKVEESWYIFPVPFINIPEKTFERVSYGIAFEYRNFRGRNETLRATMSFGYDPFFALSYKNPLLIPSADISFLISGLYSTPINKSPTAEEIYGSPFEFITSSGSIAFGKRLNLTNNIYLVGGYSYIEAPSEVLNPTMASGTKIDRSLSAGLSYEFDTRNLRQFADRGYYFITNYSYKGIGSREISYHSFDAEVRSYRKIVDDLLFKYRIGGRTTFGKFVPLYDYSILGFEYYTRGNRYLVREGNNALIGSIELGYPILKEWNFGIKLPVIPKSLSRARIKIIFNIFADAATVFNNGDRVTLNDFNSGYGLGFTFLIMPYLSFRTEYAWNEMGRGEFLFESGISF